MMESGVLGFVLGEHPAHFTAAELQVALNYGPGDFSANDAVMSAIGNLVGAGLLIVCGGAVLPTRAALYVSDLEVG